LQPDRTVRTLLLGYILAAAFVLLSGALLPDRVASHFDASGAANGFTPRTVYLALMFLVCTLPLGAALAMAASVRNPKARLNLPHREFWLAPERREEAVWRIRRGMAQFNTRLLVFLCYVQGLVVRANGQQPAHLDSAWMIGGLAVFAVVMLAWLLGFARQFRRVP
jgi:uncharacterized membrane protein